MADKGVDALFVTYPTNRFYLSGFELHDPQCNESAGALLVGADGTDWLLTDPRYLDAARRIWPEDNIFIYKGKRVDRIREFLLKQTKGLTIGFDPSAISVADYAALAKSGDDGKLTFTEARGMVERLRVIKDADEIELMRTSAKLNHFVFDQVPGLLETGRTELEIAWDLEKLFRENGASELAFETIVGIGPNGALPHAIPGNDKILPECPVLVDMGARLGDYCSDQTRVFWHGKKPTDEYRRTLELVQEAQARAIDKMRPGEPIQNAYNAAKDYFEKHGVAEYFTHSLGHGVGLDTHESPSANPLNTALFEAGMVVTAEPGLYYPEWGGVRWEYMILVTEEGPQAL